uniref:Ribosome biogenesis protein NOP53 n=1 Tax=Heterorhabditis bacteriophora TaxID=37862 RepID=A0A1I7X0L6_HETBA
MYIFHAQPQTKHDNDEIPDNYLGPIVLTAARMGLNPSSREEKLKLMKTSNSRKTTRKLNRLGKKGKLSRNIIDGLKDIKARKSQDSHDWVCNRVAHYNDEAEDNLPLDMLDADINWENSSFANMKRRHDSSIVIKCVPNMIYFCPYTKCCI